jgi:hypothetical protein
MAVVSDDSNEDARIGVAPEIVKKHRGGCFRLLPVQNSGLSDADAAQSQVNADEG